MGGGRPSRPSGPRGYTAGRLQCRRRGAPGRGCERPRSAPGIVASPPHSSGRLLRIALRPSDRPLGPERLPIGVRRAGRDWRTGCVSWATVLRRMSCSRARNGRSISFGRRRRRRPTSIQRSCSCSTGVGRWSPGRRKRRRGRHSPRTGWPPGTLIRSQMALRGPGGTARRSLPADRRPVQRARTRPGSKQRAGKICLTWGTSP